MKRRVIDRPDLRALSPIGEVERLQGMVDSIESVLRRHLSAANKVQAIKAILANARQTAVKLPNFCH
jgi:hypothetical protein